MLDSLTIKIWRDSRWLLVGCTSVVFAFATIRVWLVSQLDTSRFRQILELLPGDFRKWTPVEFDWIVSYPGRISFTLQEPLVHLCLFVWCIARGSDAVSGELDRGTLEMMLSQPVSRRRYLATHTIITTLGVLVISSSLWFGSCLGIASFGAKVSDFPQLDLGGPIPVVPLPFLKPVERVVPMRDLVDPFVLLPAVVAYGAMGLALAGLTTFASACDRYRWRTVGIAAGFYVVQTILKLLSTVVSWLGWLRYTTVFSVFTPEKFVSIADLAPHQAWAGVLDESAAAAGVAAQGIGAGGAIALFLVLATLGFGAAFIVFERRDLPAPL